MIDRRRRVELGFFVPSDFVQHALIYGQVLSSSGIVVQPLTVDALAETAAAAVAGSPLCAAAAALACRGAAAFTAAAAARRRLELGLWQVASAAVAKF